MRNVNNYYYTKNYKNRATDHRQDQKPTTTTTHEMTTNGERPSHPPSETPNSKLQMTEDKLHPNPTTMTDHTKKTATRKKDVAIQVVSATLQLNKKVKMLYIP